MNKFRKNLLLFFVFTTPFSEVLSFDIIGTLTVCFHDIICLIMITVWSLDFFLKGSLHFRLHSIDRKLVLFLLWLLFSWLLSIFFFVPHGSILDDYIITHLIAVRNIGEVFIAYFYTRSLRNIISVKEIFNTLILSSLVVSVITFFYTFQYGMLAAFGTPQSYRPQFPLISSFALLYLTSLFFHEKKNFLWYFCIWIAILLNLFTVIVLFEKKTTLGIVISLGFLLLTHYRTILRFTKLRFFNALALSVIVLIIVIPLLFSIGSQSIYQLGETKGFKAAAWYLDYVKNPLPNLIGELKGTSYAGESARLNLWKIGWEVFMKNPITGVGYGNFSYFSSKVKYRVFGIGGMVSSHNIFIQIMAEAGLVGLLLFVLLLSQVLKNILKVRIRENKLKGMSVNGDAILLVFIFSLSASLSCTLLFYAVGRVFSITNFLWVLWACTTNIVSSRFKEVERCREKY